MATLGCFAVLELKAELPLLPAKLTWTVLPIGCGLSGIKKLCNVESDMTTMNIMLLKHTCGDKLGTQLEQTEHYYYANTM